MSTIAKRPVTLSVAEVESLVTILSSHASANWSHARRTKSAAIRDWCETTANAARDLEAAIVRRLYVQSDEQPQHAAEGGV